MKPDTKSLILVNDAVIASGSDQEEAVAVFQIIGTWTGVVTFEACLDEATWVAVPAVNCSTGAIGTTATANGLYAVGTMGMLIRARFSTASSGTANVLVRAVKGDLCDLPLWQSGAITQSALLVAGEAHIGEVGSPLANPSANFTRPADTTQYAIGDLVANNVTAGSVVPLSWATAARVAAGSFMVRRVRLKKSGTVLTSASFRLHLYAASPTVTNGDNGAWLSIESSYLGSLDITIDKAFSDASEGIGTPNNGTEVNVKLASGQTIYGLLEARGAYTPGNAEVFTAVLEILQN